MDNTKLANCKKCGRDESKYGVRFNPSLGAPAVYVNFCEACINVFTSPVPKVGWSGQFGGSHAHHTMTLYEPFTAQEWEALDMSGEAALFDSPGGAGHGRDFDILALSEKMRYFSPQSAR